MILAAHSDTAYFNDTHAHIRAGSHIFCSDNDPIPCENGPVQSLAQIINMIMFSASEVELAGLFVTAKAMVPLQQTLKEMKWPQPWSPIQTDNYISNGFANKTIVPPKIKLMYMGFYWLRCRDSQGQFIYHWSTWITKQAYYHTKRHPPQYHEAHRP